MERGLVTLIGMSIAYAASFLGMGLAYYAWRRRQSGPGGSANSTGDGARPGSQGREVAP